MATDWQLILFGDGGRLIGGLEGLCKRRFPEDPLLAEEAFNHVIAVLSKDNYLKLQRFRGDAKPSTFLVSCFRNALEDFARAKLGRCAPPAWLKALGELYIRVHRRLCCEHQSIQAVVEELNFNGQIAESRSRPIIRQVLERVPDCKNKTIPVPRYHSFDEEETGSAQEAAGEGANDEILTAIWFLVNADGTEHERAELIDPWMLQRITRLQNRVLHQINMSDKQKLLIRLVHINGCSLREAADTAGLNYHQARRLLQSALEDLRKVFESINEVPA